MACIFRCLLKSNSDRTTIIAKNTPTNANNAFKGKFIEFPVNSVANEVGAVVGFDDEVGLGEVEVEIELSGMVIVCVLLHSLAES